MHVGMSKDETAKAVDAASLHLDDKQRLLIPGSSRKGFRCAISFDDKTSSVVKKKKTIVTD